MKEIVIIDYQMGNLHSVSKALEIAASDYPEIKVLISKKENKIKSAYALILPGVGAFRKGIDNLANLGFISLIKELIHKGKPLLGICLGYQLLFTESEEHGPVAGLDLIKGKVVRFPSNLKVPHMGWNQVYYHEQDLVAKELFHNIASGSFFYFVHSYYVIPAEELWYAETEYGIKFSSAIVKDNIYAVQFHPEKSQRLGIKFLKNFITTILKC